MTTSATLAEKANVIILTRIHRLTTLKVKCAGSTKLRIFFSPGLLRYT